MAVNGRRPSLSSHRSTAIGDLLLLMLMITIFLLASAPCTRSKDFRVRLAGGTISEGRLEVYHRGIWGTVCDDHFDYIDAAVACNSLGFGYRGMVIGTRYGPGTGPIWMDNLACLGNESSIDDCYQFPPAGWNVSDCFHNEDVSVSCGTSPVQYGPLPNADNFFIVTDVHLRNIYQVDATSGATAQLLPFGAASNPTAVAYDPTAKLLYWTDSFDRTVNRYSMMTSSRSVIYRDPSNTAQYSGLAIDVGRQKLYYAQYADESDTSGKVGELSTNGTAHRVLYNDSYSRPRAIVIDVDNRMLYWTHWSYTSIPAIYRSSVISPAHEIVIDDGLLRPYALAIDFTAGVMYWSDAILVKIERAYLNGTGRRTLLTEKKAYYNTFVHHDGSIYFTDDYYMYIRRMNTATGSTSTVFSAIRFQQLKGLVFMPGTNTTESNGGPSVKLKVEIVIAVVVPSLTIIVGVIVVVVVFVRKRRRTSSDRSGTTCKNVVTSNPIYRCEELEGSIYDDIDENHYDDLQDETAERRDSDCKPPQLPSPRPNSQDVNQDHGYEDLKEEDPAHVYLCILNDPIEGCDQDTEAQDRDQDAKPTEQD